MKKILIILMFLLLYLNGVVALEKVFEVDMIIYGSKYTLNPDCIEIKSLSVILDSVDQRDINNLQLPELYVFSLKDGENKVLSRYFHTFSFFPSSYSEEFVNQIGVRVNIPYFENAEILEIYNQRKKLITYEILNLCNYDNVCNDDENYYSCPLDCSVHAKDFICIAVHDGNCDPDCRNKEDLDCICGNGVCESVEDAFSCAEDCGIKEEEPIEKEISSSFRIYVMGAIIFLIVIIIFIVLKKRRSSETFI